MVFDSVGWKVLMIRVYGSTEASARMPLASLHESCGEDHRDGAILRGFHCLPSYVNPSTEEDWADSVVLLFLLTIPTLIPYFDRLHATMLFWLAPSQQIRPPIYSFKQRSNRRKIVIKCAYLRISLSRFRLPLDTLVYFLIQGCFVALIVLPVLFKTILNLTPNSVPFGGAI